SEGMRSKQVVVAEPSGFEKKGDILSECTETAENEGIGGGDCCSEETKSKMWVSSSSSSMAIVPGTEISNEESDR
ncbi:hypothetical protein KI387_019449, partial [Taxus chinensis]